MRTPFCSGEVVNGTSARAGATFTTFYEMAQPVLRSPDAARLLEHVQSRLLEAMNAAGFTTQAWRNREAPADDPTLAGRATSLMVTDPLNGVAFDVYLAMTLKQARNGCMLNMRTEARRLPDNQEVVKRAPLMFFSWDVTDLQEMDDAFRKAITTLAAEPGRVFADTDFEILPQQLTLALAP